MMFYTVHCLLTTCECKLSCRSCNVCVHKYNCSSWCNYSWLSANTFSHSHEVIKHLDENSQKSRQPDHKNSEIAKYFIDTALPQHPESKRNVQQKLYQLQTLVEECTDSDALNAAAKHLQNAITAVKALQQNAEAKQILPIKRVYAANRNHEKQNHFFSTKKRKVSKSDWAKPTLEERI